MNPTNEQELRAQFVDAMWNYFGIEDKSELDHFRTIFDEVVNPLVTAHTNAAIAKVLDSLEAEFDRHAKSWIMGYGYGLVLDMLARTGNLSSEQKEERDAMVIERRALAVLHGAIQAERAKLKEVK